MPSLELPVLCVEGSDDVHSVLGLLSRHGIALDTRLGPVVVEKAGSFEELRDIIGTRVRASSEKSVGFVVDADIRMQDRWQTLRRELEAAGVRVPDAMPSGGLVLDHDALQSRVGVWIMPDCFTDFGKLENLLESLIPATDPLWPHAKAATADAKSLGARFREVDILKAELHVWLAWQADPGVPYGTAIRARYFHDDSAAALAFVKWFRELYAHVLP